jgi:hypothetical protein
MLLTFARQSKNDQGYSGERLVNFFMRPTDGLSEAVLMGASGTKVIASISSKPIRSVIQHSGAIYLAANSNLWLLSGSTVTSLGAIADGETHMASNGTQIAIVSGNKYQLYDGTTVAEYSTGAIENPIGLTYQDGYFVVIGESAGRSDAFTISGLDDGKTFNALDFAFAENSPDGITGIVSDHGELWLFGSRTVEVFYNSGNIDFPFQRNAGSLMEVGCLGGETVAKVDNSVFWISPDLTVYRSGGGSPEVISSREIEEQLAGKTIGNCFTFTDKGHKFYAISTLLGTTLCFDITTGLWSERSKGITHGSWGVTSVASLNGVQYVGTESGNICSLDPVYFQAEGDVLAAEFVTVPVVRSGEKFVVSEVTLRIKSGDFDLGRDHKIMMQTTKDGSTWGNEKWRNLGRLGHFYSKAQWNALGQFERFQARVRITDPIQRDIYGATYA